MEHSNSTAKSNFHFEASREFWGLAASGDKRLRAIHLRIIMVLQSYLHRGTFTAFPGLPLIARQVSAHMRTVQRAIADLEGWGYMTVERRWNKVKRCWNSNVYRPHVPRSAITETLQNRYDELLPKLSPPPGEKTPSPPGVEMPPPSRRENVVITSDLTSEVTSERTSISTSHAYGVGDLSKDQKGKGALQGKQEPKTEPLDKLSFVERQRAQLHGDTIRDFIEDYGPFTFAGLLKAMKEMGHDIGGAELAAVVNAGIVRHDGKNVYVPD